MNKTYKLFAVKNFDNTAIKHAGKVTKLEERFKELGIDYHDILDSNAWQTIDTQVENYLSLLHDRSSNKMNQRQIAKLINQFTRDAILGSLEHFDIPRSYDTAFFVAHYTKTIEGMVNILETINERRA